MGAADSPILGPSGLVRPWKPVAHRGLQPGTPQALLQGKGVVRVLQVTLGTLLKRVNPMSLLPGFSMLVHLMLHYHAGRFPKFIWVWKILHNFWSFQISEN